MDYRRRDLRNASLCPLITLLALLCVMPFCESGINDDWSYARTAWDLARTGHLYYNGWAAAMLGAQAYWGALFVKLLGPTYLALRISSALLAAGSAALLYALHRRSQLTPPLAAFGALSVVLSPLLIPYGATFMTETPGLFLFLLSLYGFVRAADSRNRRLQTAAWLLLGAAAGVLGGTIRQVVWILPLVALPYLVWRLGLWRHRPRALAVTAVLWVATLGLAALCTLWFDEQPYAIRERPLVGLQILLSGGAAALRPAVTVLVRAILTVLLCALPILVATAASWQQVLRRASAALLFSIVAALVGLGGWTLGAAWFAPWMDNTISHNGLYFGTSHLPVEVPLTVRGSYSTIPFPVCIALAVLVFLFAAILAVGVGQEAWERWQGRRRMPEATTEESDSTRREEMPIALALLWLFALLYTPLLPIKLVTPFSFGVWDRYVIFLLPLATLAALVRYQRCTGRERIGIAGWLLAALFAGHGIAAAHDYFAESRARLAAANELMRVGVPRHEIRVGFEFDAESELGVTGYFNDPRITNPVGAYKGQRRPLPFRSTYMMTSYTPNLVPRFIVVLQPHPTCQDTSVPPVPYRCWFPPFAREVTVQVVDPADAAALSSRFAGAGSQQ